MMPTPPIAPKRAHTLVSHGRTRIDDYYWMRDREDPEVLAYLQAENAYADQVMDAQKDLQELLFSEMKGRVKEQDESVPYRVDGYYYYTRYLQGQEYPLVCRREGNMEAPEEVMLDVNILAKDKSYYALGGLAVSEHNDILAYAFDDVGRRIYTIRFKNLTTGEDYADEIHGASGGLAWAADNQTLFYNTQDEETLRDDRVWRHTLGQEGEDVCVYYEQDETFAVDVYRSRSRRFIMVGSHATVSSEIRYLEAAHPFSDFGVIQPRERDHEYAASHYGEDFYIVTNWKAQNFRLMRARIGSPKEEWQEVIAHRSDVLLESVEIFRDFLVVEERKAGLIQLRVIRWADGNEHYLDFGEPAYVAGTTDNWEFDTDILRFGYTSMTTPNSLFDYNMRTGEKVLLKQQVVLGTFNKDDYQSERIYAPAQDGTLVPISLVYRKGFVQDGSHPCFLIGYGSYGITYDPTFSASRLSLLDRGFVFAIAHIRGGQEMGRYWYEEGKLLRKKNTFTDFIACAEHLVAQGYTNPNRLAINGGSAGGLLIGAVVNMRPDLAKVAVLNVPFLDVVTTMEDDTIPLTTGEYDEWGNPADEIFFDYMYSYSPYDQIERKAYPNILVTSGLHDSQVQYWEPTKYVAKLREYKTDNHLLLLKTNMEAGHGGASGRFQPYRELAFEYAFILSLLS